MLHVGYADARRGHLPRLLCPLQNARSPKYSGADTADGANVLSLLVFTGFASDNRNVYVLICNGSKLGML